MSVDVGYQVGSDGVVVWCGVGRGTDGERGCEVLGTGQTTRLKKRSRLSPLAILACGGWCCWCDLCCSLSLCWAPGSTGPRWAKCVVLWVCGGGRGAAVVRALLDRAAGKSGKRDAGCEGSRWGSWRPRRAQRSFNVSTGGSCLALAFILDEGNVLWLPARFSPLL